MNDHHGIDRICRNCGMAYTPQCKGVNKCPRHPKPFSVILDPVHRNLEDNG